MLIVFDIGGTNSRVAPSLDGETLGKDLSFNTPQNFQEGMKILKEYFDKVKENNSVDSVTIGIAGVLDKSKSELSYGPHMIDWVEKPLKEELEKIFACRVYLENDAALEGLGEAILGAGKDFGVVAYLTFGTGVGGARIVFKKIGDRLYGFEPGHQIILVDKELKDLDELVGGAGLTKKYGIFPGDINDEKIWDDIHKYISIGLNNTIAYWSPEVIVLGGGLVYAGRIDIEKLKANLSKYLTFFPEIPEIRLAELGDKNGLLGALSYSKTIQA